MSNSPRYVGFLDPPYKVALTDDSGAAVPLTNVAGSNFTLTLAYAGTVKNGTGSWTITDIAGGKASYQWGTNDLNAPGNWEILVTVQFPGEPTPREFDPDLMVVYPVPVGTTPPPTPPYQVINPNVFNIEDYGAKSDGSDATAAIAAANTAANANGGGIVYSPPGTYITGPQTAYPKVRYVGSGIGITTWKLKAGSNGDLLSAQTNLINLAAVANSGSVGTLYDFSVESMTLDGNKSGQTAASYPLRFYGYNFVLRDLEVMNGYSDGALIDWNGGGLIAQPSDEMESLIDHCKFHDNSGVGLRMGGPHDSHLRSPFSFNNGSHGFHFAPNAVGALIDACHPYHLSTGVGAIGLLIEADGVNLTGCACEGSDTVQVVVLGNNCTIQGGSVFASPAGNVVGIQLGQYGGQTPIPGQIKQSGGLTTGSVASYANINTRIIGCQSGAIDFQNESGNTIIANIHQTAGMALKANRYPAATDNLWWNVEGLTSDNTLNTTSGLQFGSTNNNALLLMDTSGNQRFAFNMNGSGTLYLLNGAAIEGYADNYGTYKFLLSAATGYFSTQGHLAINANASSGISMLVGTDADSTAGLVIYPHASTQSAPLIAIQNESFVNTFTVNKNGAMQLQTASTFYSGSGAPSSGTGNNGDYYFRSDTPGTANQRIYIKSSGSWVGIV